MAYKLIIQLRLLNAKINYVIKYGALNVKKYIMVYMNAEKYILRTGILYKIMYAG